MKLPEGMNNVGYFGDIRQRTKEYEKADLPQISTITKVTKSRKYKQQKSDSKPIGRSEEKEISNRTIHFWLIGCTITLCYFMGSAGKDNVKRIITDCGKPPKIPYGLIQIDESDGTKYGSKATVVCSTGYSSTQKEVTCQANGKWSPSYCTLTDCGKTFPFVRNGHLKLNTDRKTTYGARAKLSCNPGFESNTDTIKCLDNGHWGEAVCNPVKCHPADITHGKLEEDGTTFGSTAKVKCDKGYAPSQATVSCTASGQWQPATCSNINDCAPNPCLNNGMCVDKVDDFVCKCQRWYGGKRCEIDIGPCSSNPCKNDGKCEYENDTYYCRCPEHTDAKHCDYWHTKQWETEHYKLKPEQRRYVRR